ncbi:MAG: PAS domain-containing protein [Steroidobacteraceae bacterium]|jgi:two-component system sensor histidine kinase UhpB
MLSRRDGRKVLDNWLPVLVRRYVAAYALALLVAGWGFAFWECYQDRQSTLADAGAQLMARATALQTQVAAILDDGVRAASFALLPLSSSPTTKSAGGNPGATGDGVEFLASLYLATPGRFVQTDPETGPEVVPIPAWAHGLSLDSPASSWVGPWTQLRPGGDSLVPVARRVMDRGGQNTWVGALVSLNRLEATDLQMTQGEVSMALLSGAGELLMVTPPPKTQARANRNLADTALFAQFQAIAPEGGVIDGKSPYYGDRRIYAVRQVAGYGLLCVALESRAVVLAPWVSRTVRASALWLAFTAAFLWLLWLLRRMAGAVDERYHLYRKLFDDPSIAVLLSKNGRYIESNATARKMFRWPDYASFTGMEPYQLSPPRQPDGSDSIAASRAHIERSNKEGSTQFEWTHKRLDSDEPFPALVSLSSVKIDGQLYKLAVLQDLTELKRNEERLQLAVVASRVGVWEFDLRTDRAYLSPLFWELMGYTAAEIPTTRAEYVEFIYAEDRARLDEAFQLHVQHRVPYDVEYRLRTRAGALRWCRSRAEAIWDASGHPVRMRGSVIDVDNEKRAEQFERESKERELRVRKEFTRDLLAAQEQERTRIAHELHDSLGQSLSLITNHAQLGLASGTVPEEIRRHLQTIISRTAEAIQEVRALSRNLRPTSIGVFGLAESIDRLIEQVAQSSSIQFDKHLDSIDDALNNEQASHLYRIAQEVLTNILKHSQARNVGVRLEHDLHCVRLAVSDDGRGFALEQSAERRGTVGISSIYERALIAGGTAAVEAIPGKGTSIIVEVPILEMTGTESGV